MRLRNLVRINPSKSEVMHFPATTEVTFAPMEAIADGLGGLDTSLTKPIDEVSGGSYSYFADGDILLAKVTPCFENGKKARAQRLRNGIGFATSEVHVVRPNGAKVDSAFLTYVFSSEDFRAAGMASMTGAGGLRRVSENAILDYRLAITDLPTQRAIADFLDRETARIDRLIEKKERLATLLLERTLSLIDDVTVHDTPTTSLGRHTRVLPGFAFPSDRFSTNPDDVPLLRGVNVAPGQVRWDEVVYWPRELASTFERFALEPGDLVLGMDRPWISSGIRVAEISATDVPSLLLQRVCKITPMPTLDRTYLRLLLMSKRFLAYFEPILTGVSVPHISGDQVMRFRFPYVPVETQRAIANECQCRLATNWQLASTIETSIDRLRELRSALITAAVTGQIDPATWGRRGETDRRLEAIERVLEPEREPAREGAPA